MSISIKSRAKLQFALEEPALRDRSADGEPQGVLLQTGGRAAVGLFDSSINDCAYRIERKTDTDTGGNTLGADHTQILVLHAHAGSP